MPPGRLRHGQRVPERRQARLGHEERQRDHGLRRRRHRSRSTPRCRSGRTSTRASRRTERRSRSSTRRKNDGQYDIWVGSTTASDAEQETNTRNVSDVAWSPTGDWLAYVQNWSDETLEGQISLIRPNGDDAHTLVPGDAPGLVARRQEARLRPQRLDLDGRRRRHRRAPSDSERPLAGLVARRRADRVHARREVLRGTSARSARTSRSRTEPTRTRSGPTYPSERQVVWLPDPFE